MTEYPTRQAITAADAALYDKWLDDNRARIEAWDGQMSPKGQEIADTLSTDGIVTMEAGDLVNRAHLSLMHESISAQVCTQDVQSRVWAARAQPWKDFCLLLRYTAAALENHPALRVGLDPSLLKAIAGYYGFWPRLCDVCIHINYPTGTDASASQLWHRDPGDLKIVKVFIYLCDVTMDNGPFTYIPGTQAFGRHAGVVPEKKPGGDWITPIERDIRWTDEEMEAAIPRDQWLHVCGPNHTMIIADTVGFHRGFKPKEGARLLVCFTYTSGVPGPLLLMKPPLWATKDSQRWALK